MIYTILGVMIAILVLFSVWLMLQLGKAWGHNKKLYQINEGALADNITLADVCIKQLESLDNLRADNERLRSAYIELSCR